MIWGEFFYWGSNFIFHLRPFFLLWPFYSPIFNLDIWSMSLNNNFEGYIMMISIIKQDKSECWLEAYRVSIFVQYYLWMDKYCPVTEFCLLKNYWEFRKNFVASTKIVNSIVPTQPNVKIPEWRRKKNITVILIFFNTTIFYLSYCCV